MRTPTGTRLRLWLIGLTMLLAGCSQSSGPPTAVVPTPVDAATAGTIQIQVDYTGAIPAPKLLDMRSAALCAAAHSEPVSDESLVVRDGHLANAVVWIKGGLEHWVFAPPSQPVIIDQRGCMYHPHVAAAMVAQAVEFLDSDSESHNVHGRPQVVSSWNFIMSKPGSSRTLFFDKPEIGIPVGCDIHPWMQAYLVVVPNPYFAVTPPGGAATLQQVPPGDYVVAAWHEKLGTQEQHLTLAPSGSAAIRFTFGAG